MKKNLLLCLILVCSYVAKSQTWIKPTAGIPSLNVTSLAMDSTGKIWIGTPSGLAAFDNNTWKGYGLNNTSHSEQILNIWATKDSLWVGTEFKGLWAFDAVNSWWHYDPSTAGNGIIGFGKDSKGVVYRLDKFGSFDKWNGKSWTQILGFIGHANDLLVDRQDNVWIISGNQGLMRHTNGVTTRWPYNSIPTQELYSMIQDPRGFYWIASDKGLLRFDGTNFESFTSANSQICSDRTRCLAIDQKGALWVGTWDGGLSKFDGKSWTSYNTVNSPLQSNTINSIVADKSNRIWIAHGHNGFASANLGKGVFVLDEDNDISQNRLPAAPGDLTIKIISEKQVVLNWKDNSDNEVGFQIERSAGDGAPFQQIKFVEGEITSFVDLGVTAGTTYQYRIRATNAKGASAYSNSLSVLPKYCTVNTSNYGAYAIATKVLFGKIDNQPFNCINGYYDYLDKSTELFAGQTLLFTVAFDRCRLTSHEIIGGAVYIDWNSDGDFTDPQERILHNLSIKGKGEFTFPVTVPANVIPATTTRLRIRSEDAPYQEIGPCGFAEETQDYTLLIGETIALGKPTALAAKPLSAGAVQLRWQDNASAETSYVIERSLDSASFAPIASLPVNSVMYTDSNLVADTKYYYRVYARGNTGSSTISETVSATTLSVDFTKVTEGQATSDRAFSVGAFWGDYNADGRLDLFSAGDNVLYKNTDGRLDRSTVIKSAGGGAWADYDNDGDLDLFITNYNYGYGDENNLLYENKGDGTFTETKAVGTDGRVSNSVWTDYNRDGYLDLFLSYLDLNYGKLYKNNGNKSFTEVAKLAEASGFSTFADYDNDGDDDLFVARRGKDVLYDNNGDGTFTRNTSNSITLLEDSSNGASWADFDNDGDLDLFVTNGTHEEAYNVLYVNQGKKRFIRSNDKIFREDKGESYGSAWADYDNDGYLDLFVANFDQKNFLYRNTGKGSFTKITQGPLVNEYQEFYYDKVPSMGCAWGDYDNNGFLDLFVATNNGLPNLLYRNKGNLNHWIRLSLRGGSSNRSAIGARVQIKADNQWQYQQVHSQTGFAGQNSLDVEFGLGRANLIDSLVVLWPSGTRQLLANVSPDQFLAITEPITYGLAGTVTAADDRKILAGKVVLYEKQTSGRFVVRAEYRLNSSSDYRFKNLLPGKYAVQAIPDTAAFPGVTPGYWNNAVSLARAALAEITTADLAGIDIRLPLASNQLGEGNKTIKGILVRRVGDPGGRVTKGMQAQGTPIPNVPLFLLTVTDSKVIRQTVTDEVGGFTFLRLPAGQYQMQIDYQGIPMDPSASKIEISATTDTLAVTATIYEKVIKTQVAAVTGAEELFNGQVTLYPNPFSSSFAIKLDCAQLGKVSVRVINSGGAVVRRLHFKKVAFAMVYPVNLQEHRPGVYTVEIQFEETPVRKVYKIVKL